MAASASTGVEMTLLHHDQCRVYSEKLYKSLLLQFKKRITVADFIDIPIISDVITISERQEIEQEDKHKGQQAGAAYLLRILERKSDWFNRIIMAMDHEECKLSDFIPTFRKIKEEVDREWLAKYPDTAACSLSEDRPCAPVSVALPPGIPESDFNLELSAFSTRTDGAQDPLTTRNTLQVSNPALVDADETLADARSAETDTGHLSSRVGRLQIQTDAAPEAAKESVSSQVPRQQLRRQDHPGLRDALSFSPGKDFDRDFVRRELQDFAGFSSDEEDKQIIRQLRPHLWQPGTYIIFFWALAKRPTICVVTEGQRFLTFVVHKTSKNPPSFFVDKRIKRSQSLKEIVQYHIENGIPCTSENSSGFVQLQRYI